jgi:malonyl-CoA O-methyltransferase
MSVPDDAAFALESATVARAFDNASARYEAAAGLQARVRAALLERLDELKPPPDARAVLDLGAGTGAATAALRHRFRKARVIALDLAPGMLRQAARHQRLFRRFDRVLADAARLPLREASLDVAYSNLMLQWFDDPAVVFTDLARAMRPGGLFVFSTFGPDTLRELRTAWESADPAGVHVNRFLDVHDLGGALQRGGFAEPVLDVDRLCIHHADVADLLRGLKAIGAHNVNAGRARALTGRRRYQAMVAAYESLRTARGLPATWEIVYGIAWASGAHRDEGLHVRDETRIDASVLLGKLKRRPG